MMRGRILTALAVVVVAGHVRAEDATACANAWGETTPSVSTAVVDESGPLFVFEDLYGHDAEVARVLAWGYPYPQ